MTSYQIEVMRSLAKAIMEKDSFAWDPLHDLLCECGFPYVAKYHSGCIPVRVPGFQCDLIMLLLGFSIPKNRIGHPFGVDFMDGSNNSELRKWFGMEECLRGGSPYLEIISSS